uniref:GS catalytic domain-containing protein n=1 Tax=Palpitomonas bilix TaxID=652834 RepID=A0A7S3GDK5_9EUKA
MLLSKVSRSLASPSSPFLPTLARSAAVRCLSTSKQITQSELAAAISNDEVNSIVVGCVDTYGRMMGKRYDPEHFMKSAYNGESNICNWVLTTSIDLEPRPGFAVANWDLGFGDFMLELDYSSLRRVGADTYVLGNLKRHVRGEGNLAVPEDPRTLLSQQTARLAEMGYGAMAASELEHYVFKSSFEEAKGVGYRNADLKRAGWYPEDYHLFQSHRTEDFNKAVREGLKRANIPVETTKGETGIGQHEINISYSDALDMADQHTLFKTIVKQTAEDMGVSVTFMAKPFCDPDAGSSCHIHLSLVHKDSGKNAFTGSESFEGIMSTPTFRHFLGGWMKATKELMPFYAPTINSYKRFVKGSWAPTAIVWGDDNRTTGFRVVGEGQGLRIECRIPGADVNPYLAFSAAIASGIHGIEQKIEPPAIFQGNAYIATDVERVPTTLREAASLFSASELAKDFFWRERARSLRPSLSL